MNFPSLSGGSLRLMFSFTEKTQKERTRVVNRSRFARGRTFLSAKQPALSNLVFPHNRGEIGQGCPLGKCHL